MCEFIRRQLLVDARITEQERAKDILQYIPQKDEIIYLSEKIGLSYGGDAKEEYDLCHADNRALFERAAHVFDDPILGFDFMIPDITRSWKDQRCGFLEANTVPFINLHHEPRLGTPRNIAAHVWDLYYRQQDKK